MSSQDFLIWTIFLLVLVSILLPIVIEVKDCLVELRRIKESSKHKNGGGD